MTSSPLRRLTKPRARSARAGRMVTRAGRELVLAVVTGLTLTIICIALLSLRVGLQPLPVMLEQFPLLWAALLLPIAIWAGRLAWAGNWLRRAAIARRRRRRPQRSRSSANARGVMAALPSPRRIAIAGLTGILDRPTFDDEAQRILDQRKRDGSVAVLLFDTHQYTLIEQSMDDHAARLFVQQVANRLRGFCAEDARIGHLGRDRFVLIFSSVGSGLQVADLAGRIASAFTQPVTLFEDPIQVQVSIGVALAPQHGRDLARLLERAETARFAATIDGLSCAVFRDSLETGHECRARQLMELDHALRTDGLIDDYALQQATVAGHMPRFRQVPSWPQPDGSAIGEAAFLNLPSRVPELFALTQWSINQALSRLAAWKAGGRTGLGVVVRLPDEALARLPLAAMVQRLLLVHRLSAPMLTLEVSARALAASGTAAREQLQLLRDARVGIALGDVGDGLATPSAALRYPVTEIRLLPGLLSRAHHQAPVLTTLKAMIGLARDLGLVCVIPGIASDADLSLARQLGCDRIEGPRVARLLRLADQQAARSPAYPTPLTTHPATLRS